MKTNNLIKKTSTIVAIFVLSLLSEALINSARSQTLQFSRVLLVSTQQTVPAGPPNDYVWKVVSCLGPRTESAGGSNLQVAPPQHLILVNGASVSVATNGYGSMSTGGSGSSYWWASKTEVCTTMPFWLPTGATLEASTNVNYISVVEFKVIP